MVKNNFISSIIKCKHHFKLRTTKAKNLRKPCTVRHNLQNKLVTYMSKKPLLSRAPTLKLLKILSRVKQDTLHEITMVRFYYRLES